MVVIFITNSINFSIPFLFSPFVANLPSSCRNTYSRSKRKIYPDDLTRIYYVAQALLNIQQD
jgi:hypothetical protein